MSKKVNYEQIDSRRFVLRPSTGLAAQFSRQTLILQRRTAQRSERGSRCDDMRREDPSQGRKEASGSVTGSHGVKSDSNGSSADEMPDSAAIKTACPSINQDLGRWLTSATSE